MKNNILNVELISNNKLKQSDLDSLKEKMEVREDFILLYSVFMEVMELNFNGCMEIYLEDVEIESDLQEAISKMIYDLDEIVPGGLSNDSKIEWITPQHISNVWYKDNNNWLEKTTDTTERDFFDDEWSDDYDRTYGFDDFNDGIDDNNW
jgi:hypothetical protein